MDEQAMMAGLTKVLALQERDRLKETNSSGVVDWGTRRRLDNRYEAYWRGMSIGLFANPEDAWAFVQQLG
jgi:hypothetical protein